MKTAVFDLDGTLYDGSTLKDYFIYGARTLLARGHIAAAGRVVCRSLLSMLKLQPHADAKYDVCVLLSHYLTEDDIKNFASGLMRKIRPSMLRLISELRKENYRIVMATASPEEYTLPLGELLGVDEVVATPLTPSRREYTENRGANKIKNLRNRGVEDVSMVVTDHYDDLPLLQINTSGSNLVVNPSATTLSKLKEAGVNYKLFSPIKKD